MYEKPGLFLLMLACFGLLNCPAVHGADQASTRPSSSPAVTSAQKPGKPEFIRVAFTDFPPWSFKDSSGKQKGILVDFFHDLAESVGLPLKVETVPISRLHHFLSHGKLDLFVARMAEKGYDCCLPLDKVFDIETVIIGRKSGPPWTPSPSGTPQASVVRV
jgi:ABC-type amino acid transport substrate-binding protein